MKPVCAFGNYFPEVFHDFRQPMKKLALLLTAIVPLLCVSCGDGPESGNENTYITISGEDGNAPETTLLLDVEDRSRTFTIESNGSWNVTKSYGASWLTLSSLSGTGNGSLTLTADAGTQFKERTATVTLYLGSKAVLEMTVTQRPGGEDYLKATVVSEWVPFTANEIVVTIKASVTDWEYKITGDNTSWLTQKNKTSTRLTLNAAENPGPDNRTATLVFSSPSQPELSASVPLSQRKPGADLLDVVFNSDGTATDVSPMGNKVETFGSDAMTTYRNDAFGHNVAWFNHTPGASASSGYFKVSFENNTEFRNALADGHTLETVFMYNDDLPIDKEVKPFSAMQGGGTGFLLSNNKPGAGNDSQIAFIPNVSANGSSSWKWTYSGVRPVKGTYYHVVAVWDKQNAKSYIYVNGEPKGSADANGNFNFAQSGCNWFGIGGDSSASGIGQAWRGDIATAKVYDAPLAANKVAELWNEVKDKIEAAKNAIVLSDIVYLSGVPFAAGSPYKISAEGFAAGDRVRFVSLEDGDISYDRDATLTTGAEYGILTTTLPPAMASGKYRMLLLRGSATAPIGNAEITIQSTPVNIRVPGVIAHRGYWTTNPASGHNSIASLRSAYELGGLYGSEADFFIMADDTIVANHDATYNGIDLQTSDYTALSGGLPRLQDFFGVMKEFPGSDTKLIIEVKSHSDDVNNARVVDKIVAMVAEAGMTGRVEYIAFSWFVCRRLVEKAPAGTVVGYLNGNKTPAECKAAGVMCIDYSMANTRKNPQYVKQAQTLGMVVNVWTVNNVSDMVEFINMGVDYISSDYPQTLKRMVELLPE